MKIGYIRISTTDQNTARQEVIMQELGVDQVYIDRMSGKSLDRPELKRMLNYVREGDVVIVESISRFARNTRDLLELMEKLNEKTFNLYRRKRLLIQTHQQDGLCLQSLELLQSWSVCQRQSEIVRKRRRNFVVFRRRVSNKIKRHLAGKEC